MKFQRLSDRELLGKLKEQIDAYRARYPQCPAIMASIETIAKAHGYDGRDMVKMTNTHLGTNHSINIWGKWRRGERLPAKEVRAYFQMVVLETLYGDDGITMGQVLGLDEVQKIDYIPVRKVREAA